MKFFNIYVIIDVLNVRKHIIQGGYSMNATFLRPHAEVLCRMEENVHNREPFIWIRQELKGDAEARLRRLRLEGKIFDFEYDASRSTFGSACYQIEY